MYAAPITVIVLGVVDSAQAVTGADVGRLRWRLLRHCRGRPLLLRLSCRGGILLVDLLHLRRVLDQQQATIRPSSGSRRGVTGGASGNIGSIRGPALRPLSPSRG